MLVSSDFGCLGAMSDRSGDKELISRSLGGDREAYRVLVEKYQNRVYALVHEILRSREDAEDVVQETFVKAYLSLASFKGQSSFYTWLYRIGYNMAIDFKRRAKRRSVEGSEFSEGDEPQQSTAELPQRFARPDQALEDKEQLVRLNKALQEISEEHRTVVMLREVEGLSYEEIADTLRISKGTVMSRLFYARRKIQSFFDEAGGAMQNGASDVSEEVLRMSEVQG